MKQPEDIGVPWAWLPRQPSKCTCWPSFLATKGKKIMSSKTVAQAYRNGWEWWGLLFVAVNCLAYKELTETSDRCGISRPSGGDMFTFFSFFSLFYTLKRLPCFFGRLRLWSPSNVLSAKQAQLLTGMAANREGVEGAFWVWTFPCNVPCAIRRSFPVFSRLQIDFSVGFFFIYFFLSTWVFLAFFFFRWEIFFCIFFSP